MKLTELFPAATTIFLDMNGTFMFGHDRLGDEQDFYASYLSSGGTRLSRPALNLAVRRAVARLDELYASGNLDADFPSVAMVLAELLSPEIDQEERHLVELTIAAHEIGIVSDEDASALESMSKRYDLYVVSNLWSISQDWRTYLANRLCESTIAGAVFSSDIGVNKPALDIFEHAVALCGVAAPEIVMIGDDIDRDILPAMELGFGTILVAPNGDGAGVADYVVANLQELL